MKIVATGRILSLGTTKLVKNTKQGQKQYVLGTAEVTSPIGKGMIVDCSRTLGEKKAEIKIGDTVTLHGDTDRVLTLKDGRRTMPFEIQSGQAATAVVDIFKAFGIKTEVAAPTAAAPTAAMEPVNEPADTEEEF